MEKIYNILVNRQKFFLFSFLRILVMLITLVTNIIIIQKLDVVSYGSYSLAMVMLGTLLTFGFFWSSSSIMYFGSREMTLENTINKSFWSRVIIMGTTWILLTILFIIFRTQINDYLGMNLAFILYIWLLLAVVEDFFCRYYLALKQQIYSNIIALTSKVLFLLLVVFCDFDVRSLLLLDAASHLSLIFFIFRIKKSDIGKFVYDEKFFKEILKFSLWQILSYSLIYLLGFADNIIIRWYLSTNDLAMYNVAYRLFNNVIGFSSVILNFYASVVMVSIAKGDKHNIYRFFYRQRFIIVLITTFGHLFLIATSQFFINLLFTDKYSGSVIIFNILMIGSIFRYISVFYNIFLNATGRYKQLQYINITTIVLNMVLNMLVVHDYGVTGVARTTSVTLFVMFLISTVYTEPKIRNWIKT